MANLVICAIFKNEAAYLYEWLSFHAYLGVNHFYLYDNGSTDQSLKVIRSWPDQSHITVIDWPHVQGQNKAYSHMIETYKQENTWCAFIDCDEFLCPQEEITLTQIIDSFDLRCNGLFVHWLMFGSSGQIDFGPGLVTERFTRRAPNSFSPNNVGKSIIKLSAATAAGNCHVIRCDGQMLNDNGEEIDQTGTGIHTGTSHRLLAINHYFTKSLAEWRSRRRLGKADKAPGMEQFLRTEDEFHRHDQNVVQDLKAFSIMQEAKLVYYGGQKKMSVTPEDVVYAYRFFLGREPVPGEVELWLGCPNLETLRIRFENSPEAKRTMRAQANTLLETRYTNPNLIFDIGMSEGNDTDFYLRKGFRVIGVEADPVVYRQLEDRFINEIREGHLIILNRLAGSDNGIIKDFWRNEVHQGLSSARRHDAPGYSEHQTRYDVPSINWSGITDIAGVAHYCKIDIEGAERDLLKSIGAVSPLPTYISAEAHNFSPIENLFLLGYRKFKIIDQNILNSFIPMPNPPMEGLFVENPNWNHASGPFGQELPGDRWLSFEEVTDVFRTLMHLRSYRTVSWTWFDVHAWSDGCEIG